MTIPLMQMMPLPDVAISVRDLKKTYYNKKQKREVEALKSISLDIPRGSIFGLLGPNGAGKSTLINTLAGVVMKTSGSATVWGYDVSENPRMARSMLGVVPQELNMDAYFTPRTLLDMHAGLYGVPKAERRTDELLAAVGLTQQAQTYQRALSGGMRRRLMVAKALVHNPPVLILDEPTAGVDVELRRHLWDYVRALNASGTTVLLTTHYLEEAEELCDHIAIINHGKVVACEPKARLMGHLDNKQIKLRLATDLKSLPDDLRLQGWAWNAEIPNQLVFNYRPSESNFAKLLEAIQSHGMTIEDLTTQESDLEDIFLQLTKK